MTCTGIVQKTLICMYVYMHDIVVCVHMTLYMFTTREGDYAYICTQLRDCGGVADYMTLCVHMYTQLCHSSK